LINKGQKLKKEKLFNKTNVKCFCCGKMVVDEGYKQEDKLYCSKECYDFSLKYKKFREEGV